MTESDPAAQRQLSNGSNRSLFSTNTDVSKFDITVFPNASALNVVSTKKKLTKIEAPNPPLRSLEQVPHQLADDDDDEDGDDPLPIIVAPHNYLHPTPKQRMIRMLITALSIVTILLLFIGMCLNATANADWTLGSGSNKIIVEIKCSWTHWREDENISQDSFGGAFVCLLFMILSLVIVIIAVIYVQPLRIMERKCLCSYLPRILFGCAFLCILISIIAFVAGDTVCFANNALKDAYTPPLEFKLGASILLDIMALLSVIPSFILTLYS